MSLTKDDLRAIKKLFDTSFDERVPKVIDERVPKIIDERVPKIINERVPKIIKEIVPEMIDARVQPMLNKLEKRLTDKIDQLTLDIGQFSLETTNNFRDLEFRLGNKVDDLDDKLCGTTEMADTNRVEIAKIKRKLKLT
ncbi:MAG TPA: hypothetical protein VFH99_01670 [Candidatus Saccharimonadales bacterium]|nr:hypothetical protein [Candidatus Saccharimonadales bacterium]